MILAILSRARGGEQSGKALGTTRPDVRFCGSGGGGHRGGTYKLGDASRSNTACMISVSSNEKECVFTRPLWECDWNTRKCAAPCWVSRTVSRDAFRDDRSACWAHCGQMACQAWCRCLLSGWCLSSLRLHEPSGSWANALGTASQRVREQVMSPRAEVQWQLTLTSNLIFTGASAGGGE